MKLKEQELALCTMNQCECNRFIFNMMSDVISEEYVQTISPNTRAQGERDRGMERGSSQPNYGIFVSVHALTDAAN